MRVLHVIPGISPRYGGPSQAVFGMCRALGRSTDIEAEILTTDADGPGGRMPSIGGNPQVHEGTVVWMFPRLWSEKWKYSRDLAEWLRGNIRRYDALHVHCLFCHSTAAACREAARAGVPVVLRTCGMLAPYSLSRSRWSKSFYWQLIERHSLDAADCLHATTPEEQEELRKRFPRKQVECIPLGVSDEALELPPAGAEFRTRFGIQAEARLVLFLSRLHRKKGLADRLLPALARLPGDIVLAVVGDEDGHDPAYAEECRQAVHTLSLESRVVFTGPIYGSEKWSAYDAADVYVLPSRHENFGATVVESMARGTPVVFCSGVQAGRYVAEAGAGLAANYDVSGLADSLREILESTPQDRESMGHRGREYVGRNLSWERSARSLATLYRELVSPECLPTEPAAQVARA